jgi:tight adherence protein B
MMIPIIPALIVFIAVLAISAGPYWLFVVRAEQRAQRAVRTRLRSGGATKARQTIVEADKPLSTMAPLARVLTYFGGAVEPLGRMIERAGATYNVGSLVLSALLLAFVGGALALHFTSSISVGAAAAAAGAILPILYVRRAIRKRLATFEEQFPEAIDLMARALRAGHALPTALELVGEEIPAPVGAEFKRLFDQQNYGLSLPEALKAFAERIPLLDARFFVTAVLTQREMGGNLSEVLDKLAAVIRERFKVKRQVRAVSAHGRITGVILGLLPPAVAAALLVINPSHIKVLIEDPIGVDMVIAGITLQVIGVVIVRRIVNVEY